MTDDRIFGYRGESRLRACYYGFKPTGVDEIDDILACVAAAGKGYHCTSDWAEEPAGEEMWGEGKSYIDLIQEAADRAAGVLMPKAPKE